METTDKERKGKSTYMDMDMSGPFLISASCLVQVAIVKAEAFKRERRLKERLEASLLETSNLVSQRNALKAALQDMQAAARRRL